MATSIVSFYELAETLRQGIGFEGLRLAAEEDGILRLQQREAQLALIDNAVLHEAESLEIQLEQARTDDIRPVIVCSEADSARLEQLAQEPGVAALCLPVSRQALRLFLRDQLELVALTQGTIDKTRRLDRYRYELDELVAIARALASEHDVVKLLALILEKCRTVTGADAGSIYIVEGEPPDWALRFVVSQNESWAIDFHEFTLPIDDHSLAGAAALERRIVHVPDLRFRQSAGGQGHLRHHKEIDRSTGYETRSVLTVPLLNQQEEPIGVIQLINKKAEPSARLWTDADFDRQVIPFTGRDEELCGALATIAGISLENALLYHDIRSLFEGFVRAAVTAIESRDPSTSGHSQRVAALARALAEEVDRTDTGPYASLHFAPDDYKQIEYASLLHDFGKVGVREQILVKARKLYESERALLVARFDFIRKSLEAELLACRVKRLEDAQAGDEERERTLRSQLAGLDDILGFILQINEPSVEARGSSERLEEVAQLSYVDARGRRSPYLTAGEIRALGIPRGSLTEDERREIESHVVHTYNFLRNIPWGRALGRIPEIAGAHHELLDGSGYPRQLVDGEIAIESRIMTIADIFDALTAADRPYKRAIPVERALDLLADEVKRGRCDAELYRIFVESTVWRRVFPESA